MFFAYVLKSNNFEYYYKGHCSDLQKRLLEHNAGRTPSIKPFIPFSIVYYETFETLEESIKREKY
ncbi:GIY-YIG nuclease family protein, partial [Acinetobacter baumannii]